MSRRRATTAATALLAALLFAACGSTTSTTSPPAGRSPAASGSLPATTSPTTDPARPTAAESAMAEALVRFARNGVPGDLANVPLASDVWLGLGPEVVVSRPTTALRDRAAWWMDAPAFRGYAGPFSALDLMARDGRLVIRVGDHPHCASGPVPAPTELAGLRRVSLQPESPDGCLEWWTVDLFLNDRGAVAGITLDLWEP